MDTQNLVLKVQPKLQPKAQPKVQPKKTKQPQPVQVPGGPEIWDGNNDGWTYVSYSRKKKSKK